MHSIPKDHNCCLCQTEKEMSRCAVMDSYLSHHETHSFRLLPSGPTEQTKQIKLMHWISLASKTEGAKSAKSCMSRE